MKFTAQLLKAGIDLMNPEALSILLEKGANIMDPQLIATLAGLVVGGGLGAWGGAKGVRALDARKARKEKEFYDYISEEARKKGFRPPLNPIDQAVEAKNLIIQGKDKEIEELAHKLKMLQDTTKGMKDNLNIAGNGVSMFKDVAAQNKSLNDSLTQARSELSKLQGVSADNKTLQESLAQARKELSQLQGVAENNKTLQETMNGMKDTIKRLEMDQGKYKGLGNAAKNLGGELLTFAKNNKGLTAGVGLGAAGLAALPFLLGSSNKEASFNEDVVVNDITKTALCKLAGYYGY